MRESKHNINHISRDILYISLSPIYFCDNKQMTQYQVRKRDLEAEIEEVERYVDTFLPVYISVKTMTGEYKVSALIRSEEGTSFYRLMTIGRLEKVKKQVGK